ncbi:MAG: hypothetical protein WC644_01890 [Ignavibacteria bacterium]
MAKLISPMPFGRLSGKLGELVFRNYPDKIVVSKRPLSFKPGSDPASVNRRQRFKLASMFAKSVKSLTVAYEIWAKKTQNKMSAYNCVFKHNYDAVEHNDVSKYVRIFPDSHFLVHPDSFIFTKDYLHVSFNPSDLNIPDYYDVKYMQVALIIFCKESLVDYRDECRFLTHLTAPVKISADGKMSFSLALSNNEILNPDIPSLNDSQKSVFASYNSHSVFIAFMALDSYRKYVRNSQTLSILNQ